jgi:hypothetical protein
MTPPAFKSPLRRRGARHGRDRRDLDLRHLRGDVAIATAQRPGTGLIIYAELTTARWRVAKMKFAASLCFKRSCGKTPC